MNLFGLYKLFRVKPVIAWGVCGFILSVSVAIYEQGLNLNWNLLLWSFFVIILLQAFLAHAVNDLADEKVDRITDIKGTGRYKVLISGIMSRYELIILSLIVAFIVVDIIYTLYLQLGYKVLIFSAVGLYAPLAYSLPPLKLGWKPFSEWTVVFPVLVALVMGINFVATGTVTTFSFWVGVVFAFFNVLWFYVSRLMDIEPDDQAGKITTAVFLRRHYGKLSNNKEWLNYFNLISYFYIVISLLITFKYWIFIFTVMNIVWYTVIYNIYNLSLSKSYDSKIVSDVRKYGIVLSILNSLTISFILTVESLM